MKKLIPVVRGLFPVTYEVLDVERKYITFRKIDVLTPVLPQRRVAFGNLPFEVVDIEINYFSENTYKGRSKEELKDLKHSPYITISVATPPTFIKEHDNERTREYREDSLIEEGFTRLQQKGEQKLITF